MKKVVLVSLALGAGDSLCLVSWDLGDRLLVLPAVPLRANVSEHAAERRF